MASKEDILKKVQPTSNYLGSFVKTLINEVTCENKNVPDVLKKGDVYITDSNKNRPSVIIKICKDYVVSINLTSTENIHNLCESNSRFFGSGYFANYFTITSLEIAKDKFIGVYDNMKTLNNAIKELRLFIVKNI